MTYYIGLDIAMKETAVCVLNISGDIVDECKIPTHPESLIDYFKKLPFPIEKIGMEACNMSIWLHRELTKGGYNCVCMEAYHASQAIRGMHVNKTDRNDAWGLAQLLRVGLYKPVHVKSVESQQLNGLLAARKTLVRQRVDLENAIRGHFREYGIRITGGEGVFIRNAYQELSKVEFFKTSIQPLLTLLESVAEQFRAIHNQLRRVAKDDGVCKLLMTIPGVGAVSAAMFKATIDDPTRFKKSVTVAAYLGLTPRIYASGETCRYGRISKHGNPGMREVLFDAAGVLLTRSKKWCALKYWGIQVAKRSCMKKAKIAVARKLAVIMHQVWITNTPYCYKREVPEIAMA